MSNRFEEISTMVSNMETDFSKFYEKGNSAAGTRVRKGLQEVVALCKELRKEVVAVKAERKAK